MRIILLTLLLAVSGALDAQKTTAQILDSLPDSQIDIPIQIDLRPVYRMAEKNVDTVFTSPNYPDGWVQADCATRYKYHFRRSPLSMSIRGTTLQLGFTGFYQIVGSTRVCVRGTVLSPWTPGCSCGFDEPERKVTVGFTSVFRLQPNYLLQSRISRSEPKALDKCEVCFWGQDITKEVINGLKAELDASKKAMEDSFGNFNLRPYMQQAWNLLSDVHAIPNVGYFSLNPKKLRMENINASNDQLHINIGITATPVVSFAPPAVTPSPVPDLSGSSGSGGFNIFLEGALQYDSLTNVLNGFLAGKRFDVSEGLFARHIVIRETRVSADDEGNLLIKVDFTGSFDGTAYFNGKPVYNPEKKTIEVQDLDYDLKTRNLLLKTAKWLFNKKIVAELNKYTSFDLSQYYDTASKTMNEWLNKEWTPGVKGTGSVSELKLTQVYALPQHLLIRSNCAGHLSVRVSDVNFSF
jgi:hypothetical protein